MKVVRLAVLCSLALVAGCAAEVREPAPVRPSLFDQRGVAMPLSKLQSRIAFAPFVPAARPLAAAAIAGLGHDDSVATHGVEFEYRVGRRSLILSEWPRQDFRVTADGVAVSEQPCRPKRFSPQGVLWATPRGLILSLQSEDAGIHLVQQEALRLIASGACAVEVR